MCCANGGQHFVCRPPPGVKFTLDAELLLLVFRQRRQRETNLPLSGGRLFRRDDEDRSESYADILTRAGLREIEGRGSGAPDPAAQTAYAMHAHGAVFAEVKVDPDLGQIRVTREEFSADQGRKRRYYALTQKGKTELETNITTWKEIARGMRLVLESAHA